MSEEKSVTIASVESSTNGDEVVIEVNRSDSHVDTSLKENLKIEVPEISIDSLVEGLLNKMEENGISLDEKSLMTIVRYSMELVELHNLNGESKKKFVLDMIKKLAVEQLDEDKAEIISRLVDSGVVESAIDMLILASKGELDINKVKEEAIEVAEEVVQEAASSCFTACLKALSKRENK